MKYLVAYDTDTGTLLSVWRLRDGDLEWWENVEFPRWNYKDLFHKVRNLHMPWDEIGYQYVSGSGYTTHWDFLELDAELPEIAAQELLRKGSEGSAAGGLGLALGARSSRDSRYVRAMNTTSPRLPVNRKERFYTGTVLPGLVCADNFRHLGLFLSLCGLHDCPVGDDVQFFTEYGFGESVYTATDKQFWQGPFSHDTPDVVVRSGDWLLTVESKMFHNPTAAALDKQMQAQKPLVDLWVERLGVTRHQHVLLLPHRLVDQVGPQLSALDTRWPVVTWEAVLDLYRGLADRYWVTVLDEALTQYTQLVSTGPQFGQHKDATLTGFDIIDGWPDHGYLTMGRQGGLGGDLLNADIASGSWRTHAYEVSRQATAANGNWFTIEEFRSRLRTT